MHKTSNGFAVLIIVAIVALAVVLGTGGWYVASHKSSPSNTGTTVAQNSSSPSLQTAASPSSSSTATNTPAPSKAAASSQPTTTSTPTATSTPQATATPTPTATSTPSPVQTLPIDMSVPNDSNMPSMSLYWDMTYASFSSNPTQFPAGSLVVPHASVPVPVQLATGVGQFSKGDILVYFVDGIPTPGQTVEHLGMVASQDNGKTWGTVRYLIGVTGQVNQGGIVDPSIVQLPNGDLRLYFFGSEVVGGDPASQSGPHVVYSALSTDGVHFTVEHGERFSTNKLTDPEVISWNGKWYMYYSLITQTQLAVSADGLNFTPVTMPSNGIGGVPGALPLSNGVRLYGCGNSGITTGFASDGINFIEDNSNAVAGALCDPAPIQLNNGEYLMIYKNHEPS